MLSALICFICLSESYYAALALYSMFLLCILLRSIRSMFSLYVGGEGRCMTVYVVHVSMAKLTLGSFLNQSSSVLKTVLAIPFSQTAPH